MTHMPETRIIKSLPAKCKITGKDIRTGSLHQSSLTQLAGNAFTQLLCLPSLSPGIAQARLQPSRAFVSADCLVLVTGINVFSEFPG